MYSCLLHCTATVGIHGTMKSQMSACMAVCKSEPRTKLWKGSMNLSLISLWEFGSVLFVLIHYKLYLFIVTVWYVCAGVTRVKCHNFVWVFLYSAFSVSLYKDSIRYMLWQRLRFVFVMIQYCGKGFIEVVIVLSLYLFVLRQLNCLNRNRDETEDHTEINDKDFVFHF
jgi:hypothetical protein